MAFINTQYKDTINSLVQGFKNKLSNPYYIHTDKKASLVNYYNQSETKSTLDEGSILSYSQIGSNSPTRYNLIEDAFLYGIEQILVNLENGDYGVEAASIESEAIVLPNTYIPIPNDYFIIKHAGKQILFKVLDVNIDTLDNGNNFYKIMYKLDGNSEEVIDNINKQVVSTYKMIINNVGTQFNSVILSNDYDFIATLEVVTERLKEYYKALFFSNKVQTLIYIMNGNYLYDSYMIEFVSKHKILIGNKYEYIGHQTYIPPTFILDYDKTIFRALEVKDITKCTNISALPNFVSDPNSLLTSRYEDYFSIDYNVCGIVPNVINPIELELIDAIKNNTLYSDDSPNVMYNIIINYFNNVNIDEKAIEYIDAIDFKSNKDIFYIIPIIIFIIETEIKKLLITGSV